MTPEWWLDELGFAGPEHLDESYVEAYDAKAGFDPTADVRLLVDLGMGPGSEVLELGAGTGTFAFAAAATGARVTAVDISPAMVATLQERSAGHPELDVSIAHAGFLSYRPSGPPPRFVYCRNALHQLPDFWKVAALGRIASWMEAGSVLRLRDLVYDLAPDEIDTGIGAWMAAAVDDPARGYTAADLAEHVRTEFGTFRWLLEPMLERTGFEIVDADFTKNVYAAYTCRRIASI